MLRQLLATDIYNEKNPGVYYYWFMQLTASVPTTMNCRIGLRVRYLRDKNDYQVTGSFKAVFRRA